MEEVENRRSAGRHRFFRSWSREGIGFALYMLLTGVGMAGIALNRSQLFWPASETIGNFFLILSTLPTFLMACVVFPIALLFAWWKDRHTPPADLALQIIPDRWQTLVTVGGPSESVSVEYSWLSRFLLLRLGTGRESCVSILTRQEAQQLATALSHPLEVSNEAVLAQWSKIPDTAHPNNRTLILRAGTGRDSRQTKVLTREEGQRLAAGAFRKLPANVFVETFGAQWFPLVTIDDPEFPISVQHSPLSRQLYLTIGTMRSWRGPRSAFLWGEEAQQLARALEKVSKGDMYDLRTYTS